MGVVGMLAASEIRRRWRGTVAIALLVGVVGAIVLATAAGARRSDTALARFNDESGSADMEINVGLPAESEVARFAETPGIASLARGRGYSITVDGYDDLAIAAPLDGKLGSSVDRSRLIAGRRPDPSHPEEITIGEELAERRNLRLGSGLEAQTFTQAQVDDALSGGMPAVPAGPPLEFRVVGIVRRPLDLGVRGASGGILILTPAFHREYEGRIGAFTDVLRVRTTGVPADEARVAAAARRMFGEAPTFGVEALGIDTEGARNAIDVLTLALWIIAGVTAVAGVVAISIVMTRDIAGANLDQPTLRGLGLTRRQRISVNGPRALIIAGGGALLAALGAVCLSPLFPIGVARRADPDPGLHWDWTVLVLAIPLIVAIVLVIALLAALRATARSLYERVPGASWRTSAVVERVAGAGARPTVTNGLRMAVQSGRGETAVPLRSAFVGAVLGVAGITAALVFAASLGHLVSTPQLYGWAWEVNGEVPTSDPCLDARDYGIGREPGVEAVGVVCTTFADVELDGRAASVWGFRSLHGAIDPEVVSGRAPRGPREIALGSVTLNALGKQVGDTVRARGSNRTLEFVIVGRIVLPTIGEPQPLADGAVVTAAGFRPLYEAGENETHFLVVHLLSGTDSDAIAQRVARIPRVQTVGTPTVPVEVTRLQQIDRVPAFLAALLGLLALVAVGHAVVTAVRRRRVEIALLKVLGFTRGQVRAAVACQATVLGSVGLLIGIPIGMVIGRFVWQLVADGLGVTAAVANPALWLVVTVPCALVLVNLIAFLPARGASRTRPAVALRSE